MLTNRSPSRRRLDDLGDQIREVPRRALGGKVPSTRGGTSGKRFREFALVEQSADPRRKPFMVAGRNEQSRAAVLEDLEWPAVCRGNERLPQRHALDDHKTEWLSDGGVNDHIEGVEPVPNVEAVSGEANAFCDTEVSSQAL